MDRFVSKRKRVEESDEGESNSASDIDKHPKTTAEKVSEVVEQAKQKQANRKFRDEWESEYFVTEQNGRPICLICRKNDFSQLKKYNFERHFKSLHSEYDAKFPTSSEKRATEILRLKNALGSEQSIVKKFLSTDHLVTRASYEVAFDIAKHGKPYSDGEFHKKMMQSTVETLCETLNEKLKTPLLDRIKKLPLSHQTVARRIGDISAKIEADLKSDLDQCDAFSLALDETTDILDMSQLLFWVRYSVDGRIEENILGLVQLAEQKRAEDVFKAFLSLVTRFNLNLNKLASVCSDGAPTMIGKHAGFAALVKKHIAENYGTQLFVSYHCIIHQENLCAQSLEKDCNVLKTVTKVSKVAVNFY